MRGYVHSCTSLVLRSRGDEETWKECQDFFYSSFRRYWNYCLWIEVSILRCHWPMCFQRFEMFELYMHTCKRFNLHTKSIEWFVRKICRLFVKGKILFLYFIFLQKIDTFVADVICNYIVANLYFIIPNRIVKFMDEMEIEEETFLFLIVKIKNCTISNEFILLRQMYNNTTYLILLRKIYISIRKEKKNQICY